MRWPAPTSSSTPSEKLETEALSKLSQGERTQYKEVKDAIATYHDKGSEQLALQKLLFQGKLPGAKDLKGEGTTLDHLARAARGNLAKGVQRGDFAGTLARGLATPSSINQRILAPALMEMANLETEYDDKSGKGAGATSTGLDKLNDAISGKNMKSAEFGDGQKDKAMSIIESELSQDRNVMTGMRFEEPGKQHSFHEVLVTGTSKENGKDYVHFTNPWGDEERMTRDDFKNRVFSANYEGSSALSAIAQAAQPYLKFQEVL